MMFDFENITIGGEKIIKLSTVDGYVIWEKKKEDIKNYNVILTLNNGSTSAVTYDDGVIPDYAFKDKENIIGVEIADGITSVGQWTFRNCINVTSITISNSVTNINDGAFFQCSNIVSVIIPNSVTNIPYQAFQSCSKLTSITIPDSVTNIGGSAFSVCANLKSIIYGGTITQWKAITKGYGWNNYVPSTCVVHCTDGDISI